MKNQRLRNLVIAALFCAFIFVVTAYLPRIPIAGGAGGYIHFGDALIYLAAALLPIPYAMMAGAIGAGLADALTGYLPWLIGTVIIKAAMASVFSCKTEKILSVRNIISSFIAGVICAGGYFLYEWLIVYKLFLPETAGTAACVVVAAQAITSNLVQAAASIVIFLVCGFALDKMGFKKRIYKKS